MTLRPVSNQLWGISGGMVKGYDNYSGSEQLSFKQFDISRNELFEYTQEVDCGCRCYIPSDNLEFVEWKYEQSK